MAELGKGLQNIRDVIVLGKTLIQLKSMFNYIELSTLLIETFVPVIFCRAETKRETKKSYSYNQNILKCYFYSKILKGVAQKVTSSCPFEFQNINSCNSKMWTLRVVKS